MHDFTVKHLGTDFEIITRNPTIGKIEFSALSSGQAFNGFGIGLPEPVLAPKKPERLITADRKYDGERLVKLFQSIQNSVLADEDKWEVTETENYISFSRRGLGVDKFVSVSVEVIRLSSTFGLVAPIIKSFSLSYDNGGPVEILAEVISSATLDTVGAQIRRIAGHVGKHKNRADHSKYDNVLDGILIRV